MKNTVAIGQMKVEPNQSLAVEIQNYATNYYSTGNSDIDLDGALNRLNKKRKKSRVRFVSPYRKNSRDDMR